MMKQPLVVDLLIIVMIVNISITSGVSNTPPHPTGIAGVDQAINRLLPLLDTLKDPIRSGDLGPILNVLDGVIPKTSHVCGSYKCNLRRKQDFLELVSKSMIFSDRQSRVLVEVIVILERMQRTKKLATHTKCGLKYLLMKLITYIGRNIMNHDAKTQVSDNALSSVTVTYTPMTACLRCRQPIPMDSANKIMSSESNAGENIGQEESGLQSMVGLKKHSIPTRYAMRKPNSIVTKYVQQHPLEMSKELLINVMEDTTMPPKPSLEPELYHQIMTELDGLVVNDGPHLHLPSESHAIIPQKMENVDNRIPANCQAIEAMAARS